MKKLLRYSLLFLFVLFSMRLPIEAQNTTFVEDHYGVIDDEEEEALNLQAKIASEQYDVGVYVRVFSDMEDYFTIEEFAEAVYERESLGLGDNNDGILLILTMEDRSFDIFVPHGGLAAEAFGQYAREQMASSVVYGYLTEDLYYGGFQDYISIADVDLAYAQAGTPISENFDPIREEQERREQEAYEAATRAAKTGATLGIPPFISILTCLGLKRRNKTEGIATTAYSYIPSDGVRLTNKTDQFMYQTTSRTVIRRDDDSGGSSSNFSSSTTSAGSHTSGHF